MLDAFPEIVGSSIMSKSGDQQSVRRNILVVCVGNPDRGDDALGAMVARKLSGQLPADVALLLCSGDALSLIEDWAGYDTLICVDAALPMGTPGCIHRIDGSTDELSSELPSNIAVTSSHALSILDAIHLACALGCAPRDIIVYAVEGFRFDAGAPNFAASAHSLLLWKLGGVSADDSCNRCLRAGYSLTPSVASLAAVRSMIST